MKKKNYIIVNSFREIKKTFRRFLSLLIMSLLGVGVFVGLKSTAPSMIKTIDNYYDNLETYDVKLVSTLGWSEQDLSYFKTIDKAKNVIGEYQTDSIVNILDQDLVIRTHSLCENMNKVRLLEGRLPTNGSEIVVESYFLNQEKLELGNTLKLDSSSLTNSEFEIVGVIDSSLYIDPNPHKNRGMSTLGGGSVSYYTYVNEEAFNSEYYTYIYIQVSGAKELLTSSKKYEKLVDDFCFQIQQLQNEISSNRRNEVVIDYKSKLDSLLPEGINNQVELSSKIKELEYTLASPSFTDTYPESSVEYQTLKNTIISLKALEEKYDEVDSLELPTISINTRLDYSDYKGFIQDADSITNLAKIFPVVFYVIAVFISLVSMSRMVEDDRLQIGTLKSLGFTSKSILSKYMIYSSLATVIGGLLGCGIFYVVIPNLIWNIYRIIFDIPSFALTFKFVNFALGVGISLLCICGVTFITTIKNVRIINAELLRPKAPKVGKRVLLERITFIWKRINFSNKVTIRNIFRYKSRVFMTIFGVAGCTALLLSGFGLKDSISGIPEAQFKQVFNYDEMIYFKTKDSLKMEDVLKDSRLESSLKAIYSTTYSVTFDENSLDVILCASNDDDNYSNFIDLSSVSDNKRLSLEDNKVIISDKMSQLLNVKVGDEITLQGLDFVNHNYQVSGIFKDYLYHYVMMSQTTYENSIGTYIPNVALVKNKENVDEKKLCEDLLKDESVLSIVDVNELIKDANNMLNSLNSVVIILIVLSGALCFVVMINLTNINIAERKREIATLKVLGFYDREVDNYIIKENIILTIFGIALGIFVGYFLNLLICSTVEIEIVRFLYCIKPLSYLYSIGLSFLFTIIVNLITHKILKKIDMIESLKSVE